MTIQHSTQVVSVGRSGVGLVACAYPKKRARGLIGTSHASHDPRRPPPPQIQVHSHTHTNATATCTSHHSFRRRPRLMPVVGRFEHPTRKLAATPSACEDGFPMDPEVGTHSEHWHTGRNQSAGWTDGATEVKDSCSIYLSSIFPPTPPLTSHDNVIVPQQSTPKRRPPS